MGNVINAASVARDSLLPTSQPCSLATLAALITFPMIAGNIMSLLDKITSEVCWKDRDQKGGGLVGKLGDDVGLPYDVELLPVHLQLVAPPLWHQDPVTNGHTHWDCFACCGISSTRSSSHNSGLKWRLLGGLWDQKTSLCLRLRNCALNKDPVKEGHDTLGNGGSNRH